MRGGTNSKVKVKGSCLKPSKNTPGINQTRPSMRRQGRAQDTKVTVISQDNMDSLKSGTNTPLVKHKQSYLEVLAGGDWGPGLSCPVWSTTSTTFFNHPNDKQEYKPPQQVVNLPSAEAKVVSDDDKIGSANKKLQVDQLAIINPINNKVQVDKIVRDRSKVNKFKKVQSTVGEYRPTRDNRSNKKSGDLPSKRKYKIKKQVSEIKEGEDWPTTSTYKVSMEKLPTSSDPVLTNRYDPLVNLSQEPSQPDQSQPVYIVKVTTDTVNKVQKNTTKPKKNKKNKNQQKNVSLTAEILTRSDQDVDQTLTSSRTIPLEPEVEKFDDIPLTAGILTRSDQDVDQTLTSSRTIPLEPEVEKFYDVPLTAGTLTRSDHDVDQSLTSSRTIPLLPEVEKCYDENPSLRGTCTRLEQELEAALSDLKVRVNKSEEKLISGPVEWWEDDHKSNLGADKKLLEIDSVGLLDNIQPIIPPAEWMEEVQHSTEDDLQSSQDCFSTVRLDWCS